MTFEDQVQKSFEKESAEDNFISQATKHIEDIAKAHANRDKKMTDKHHEELDTLIHKHIGHWPGE